jgi:hypothetical protein
MDFEYVDLSPEERAALRREAEERRGLHDGQASTHIWNPNSELIGMLGEAMFCKTFGFPLVGNLGRRGDRRKDCSLEVGTLTVDVKSSPATGKLLRDPCKAHGDILVVVKVDPEQDTVKFMG